MNPEVCRETHSGGVLISKVELNGLGGERVGEQLVHAPRDVDLVSTRKTKACYWMLGHGGDVDLGCVDGVSNRSNYQP